MAVFPPTILLTFFQEEGSFFFKELYFFKAVSQTDKRWVSNHITDIKEIIFLP